MYVSDFDSIVEESSLLKKIRSEEFMSEKKSEIKDILNDKESVLVFDVDGVLALLEFGCNNHYIYDDEIWDDKN